MNFYIVDFEVMEDGHAVQWGTLQISCRDDEIHNLAQSIRQKASETFYNVFSANVRIKGVFKL